MLGSCVPYLSVSHDVEVLYILWEHRENVTNGSHSSTLSRPTGSTWSGHLREDSLEIFVIELLKSKMNETVIGLDVWPWCFSFRHDGASGLCLQGYLNIK